MTTILDEELNDTHDESFDLDDDTIEELGSLLTDGNDRLITDYLEDPNESEELAELDRRKEAYSILKKDDKIFNNSFNMGSALDEDEPEARAKNEIRIDPGSADYNMYDRDCQEDFIDDSITQFDINAFVSGSAIVQKILKSPIDGKKKFTKTEVNTLFNTIKAGVSNGSQSSAFVNAINILDTLSSLTSLEFKKLFDMLTYENKEILLEELDKKYHFLDKSAKNFKIY